MIKDQCVSITDLRRNAKEVLERLPKTGVQYIFVNNRPKAVLVDIDDFEERYSSPVELVRLEDDEISPELKEKFNKAKGMKKSQFINTPC
ncbi:MAG: type II toxin-antitoxin system prevent-host-death family antitoxin [Candidatus Altimarinota bacterium]